MSDAPRVYTLATREATSSVVAYAGRLIYHDGENRVVIAGYDRRDGDMDTPPPGQSIRLLELPTPESSAEFVAEALGVVLEAAGLPKVGAAVEREIMGRMIYCRVNGVWIGPEGVRICLPGADLALIEARALRPTGEGGEEGDRR